MNEEQRRLYMICDWLTDWLGKSMSPGEDWFCRSAAMAYQHFVDLVAKEYNQSDMRGYTYCLHVEFGINGGGYHRGFAHIDLNPETLRIRVCSATFDRKMILEGETDEEIEMNWRTDERGIVKMDCGEIDELGFSEVLKRLNGGLWSWRLKKLWISRAYYYPGARLDVDKDGNLFSYCRR